MNADPNPSSIPRAPTSRLLGGRSRRPFSLALAGLLALTALGTFAACGEKPRPKPKPQAAEQDVEPGPAGPTPEPMKKPERTIGGVDLDDALAKAGDRRDDVLATAKLFAEDRQAAVRRAVDIGPPAAAMTLALLGSANLDELIGAMEVAKRKGDPVGVRGGMLEGVLALLNHDVAAVRDVAWETAALVADGPALAAMLPKQSKERQVDVVRLLAAWDGPEVRTALWGLVRAADPAGRDLATEAALALSGPGKPLDAAQRAELDKLGALAVPGPEGDEAARLTLLIYRRTGLEAGIIAATPPSALVDRALASSALPLALEGVRAVASLPAADRPARFATLAADPRPAVRAVLTEVIATHATASLEASAAAEKALDALVADGEGEVRVAALRARARVGKDEGKVKVLSAALTDPNRGVRLAAMTLLAQRELVALAADALADALKRADEGVQRSLVNALVDAKTRAAMKIVVQALDGEKNLARTALLALVRVSGETTPGERGAWMTWLDRAYPPAP